MAAPLPGSNRPVGKRIVIACDGTWLNSDTQGSWPSNVTRIVRALKHYAEPSTPNGQKIPQFGCYQRGVGTDHGDEDKVYGGLTGSDLAEHVREAYGTLTNNYHPASQRELEDGVSAVDEIVILGFSRGAFTARAIASLISDVGILTKVGMEDFYGVFEDWKHQNIPGRKSAWFKTRFPNAKSDIAFTDPEYRGTLIENGLTRWGMKIRAIGVWDTVGALGVPFDVDRKGPPEMSFVNAKVARHCEHAFHALALDEHRRLFTPTLWELPDDTTHLKRLKQCWFPGVHSNIGGSYDDAGISNITLGWMISQLEDHDGGILEFDHEYLDRVIDWNTQGYIKRKEPIRAWAMGRLYDSASPNSVLTAAQGVDPITRTPGMYLKVNADTGVAIPNQPLTNTNEYIHRCIRIRIENKGPGMQDDHHNVTGTVLSDVGGGLSKIKSIFRRSSTIQAAATPSAQGIYSSAALLKYKYNQPESCQLQADYPEASGVSWNLNGRALREDALGPTEIAMYRRTIEAAKLFGPGAGATGAAAETTTTQ